MELNMNNHTYIIAEAGVNHNGDMKIAYELIDTAKTIGVDAIKFQTYKTENLVTIDAKKAEYQKNQEDESQYQMLKKLELSYEQFRELKVYCDKIGIEFLSTAFDLESIDFLDDLGMKTWKIPSGEITNLPYLEKIAKLNTDIILSTGMSTLDDIGNAYEVLRKFNKKNITILHCTTSYPTDDFDANLNAMLTIKERFGEEVGYSDHTKGIKVPCIAVSMGACVIEKHFTLDNNMEGPDHKASLMPDEFRKMVEEIRYIEKVKGSYNKLVTETEKENSQVARKSIVAKEDIKKGQEFTADLLDVKRPGTGISPMNWYDVIGKIADRDYKKDDLIIL